MSASRPSRGDRCPTEAPPVPFSGSPDDRFPVPFPTGTGTGRTDAQAPLKTQAPVDNNNPQEGSTMNDHKSSQGDSGDGPAEQERSTAGPARGGLVAELTRERDSLRAEVERLRAGEAEDDGPANAVPTPGQWVKRFNDATPDERLAAAERAIANSETVHWHVMQNTQGELAHWKRVAQDAAAANDTRPKAGE